MTAFSVGILGEYLMTQKHNEEAERLLQEAHENLKNSQRGENPRILRSKSRLYILKAKNK